MKITFQSDKIKFSGPRVDGNYVVSFETGEYSQVEIAKLMVLPQNENVSVTVEYNKGK
jgi:hypothetical protein